MNDRVDTEVFSPEAVAKVTEKARGVLAERFGVSYLAEANTEEAVQLVIYSIISTVGNEIREARAAELEDFAKFIRVPTSRYSDTYTMRILSTAAENKAQQLREGK